MGKILSPIRFIYVGGMLWLGEKHFFYVSQE